MNNDFLIEQQQCPHCGKVEMIIHTDYGVYCGECLEEVLEILFRTKLNTTPLSLRLLPRYNEMRGYLERAVVALNYEKM